MDQKVRFSMNFGESVYRVKLLLQEQGITGLAVDVDDSLSQTSKGFYEILSSKFPTPSNITAKDVRKHYALTGKTLHWGNIPEAKEYSSSLENNPEFHANFKPLDSATSGMQELDQRGLIACYLTARNEILRDKTEEWLRAYNFPQKHLIMRSDDIDYTDQALWKAEVLEFLYPQISGIIDDNTRITRLLEERNYPGKVFLIGLNEQDYETKSSITTLVEEWPELKDKIVEMFG